MEIDGLYDVAYNVENNEPHILLFTRDRDKNKKIIEVNNFRPYIYADIKEYELKKKDIFPFLFSLEKVTKKYIKDENLELVKLILKNPFDVYKVKGFLTKTFESDV